MRWLRGRTTPPGRRDGEIFVRKPYQMCGYFDDPELTAETLPPDGWVRTRDLGLLSSK